MSIHKHGKARYSIGMISIKNTSKTSYTFWEYWTFCLDTLGFTKKAKATTVFLFVSATALFVFKNFFVDRRAYSQLNLFSNIYFGAALIFAFLSVHYFASCKCMYDSSKPFLTPSTKFELHEDQVICQDPNDYVHLNKKFFKKIMFKKDAVYIYYLDKAVFVLKRWFDAPQDWQAAVDFIKANYTDGRINEVYN